MGMSELAERVSILEATVTLIKDVTEPFPTYVIAMTDHKSNEKRGAFKMRTIPAKGTRICVKNQPGDYQDFEIVGVQLLVVPDQIFYQMTGEQLANASIVQIVNVFVRLLHSATDSSLQ